MGLNSDDTKNIIGTYAPTAVTVTTKNQTDEMCIKKINGFSSDIIFLPAFNSASELIDKGIMFYEDEQGTKPFDVINNLVRDQNGCSMHDLAYAFKYAKNHGDTIYAKAPLGTKFYSTAETYWQDAFGKQKSDVTCYDFTEDFKNQLRSLGLPTTSVYTAKPGDVDYDYWDSPSGVFSPMPMLNGIEYKKFTDAYAGLIINDSNAWSSRYVASDAVCENSFAYFPKEEKWQNYSYSEHSAVVLTLNFDTPNAAYTPEDSKPIYNNQEPTGIMQKVGWYSNGTVFLPAFNNATQLADNNVTFYKDEDGTQPYSFFNDIIDRQGGCTMFQLNYAYDLAKSRGDTLYAKANAGYKFYGTAYTTCMDAFNKADTATYDFKEDFKKILKDQGLPTTSVYTARPGDVDYGGWDGGYGYGMNKLPLTLNSVAYQSFRYNYSSHAINSVWTSLYLGCGIKYWYSDSQTESGWNYCYALDTDANAVALTLVF